MDALGVSRAATGALVDKDQPGVRSRIPWTGLGRVLQSLWLPVAALGLWEALVAVGVLDALFFPPPSTLVSAFRRLWESGELWAQLRMTLSRMMLGFAFGFAAGLLCGVLMGTIGAVRRCLEPIVSGLYTTPKMSLLPMVMLLFGVGNTARILLISLGAFIMLAMSTLDAIRTVSPAYIELASSYGAGRWMLLRKVYIPAALPQVFTGTRLSIGRALMVTVAIELISCPDGIGSMIWMAWQTFATEKLYIGVILTACLGALSHTTLRWLETVVVPWRRA